MHPDPHAWLVTAPAVLGLAMLYTAPEEGLFKKAWRATNRLEAAAWAAALGGRGFLQLSVRGVLGLSLIAMGVATIGSFLAFLGVIPATA